MTGVAVQLAMSGSRELRLEYSINPSGGLSLPWKTSPRRVDKLWKSTCLELFIQPLGSARYLEFNFSPSREWAAYAFFDYREGMALLDIAPPLVGCRVGEEGFAMEVRVVLPLDPPFRVGLSAVIEETDGRISYWALDHPAAKPDFHHSDSFVHEIK